MSKLAVIDIGTNSIHMVLVEIGTDFSYKVMDRFKDMVRLGDGTFTNSTLSEAAMARGIDALRNLTTLARNKGFERTVATATSAVREAKNGGEFIQEVEAQTGLNVQVITGKEEARLIYLGVGNSMELSDDPSLIADVGGGSVEVIACNRKQMLFGRSLKLGTIRLKDRYLKQDPPTKSQLKELEKTINDGLDVGLKSSREFTFASVVATSGTAGNLTEIIYLRRTGKPVPQLNLATIELDEIRSLEAELAQCEMKSRLLIPGLDPKRVDTLLPGAMFFRCLLEKSGAKTLTISDKALREGLIFDFIKRNREGLEAEKEIPNTRRRNIILFGRKCHFAESHALHVSKLALQVFDDLKLLHGLGDQEREWLDYAALLHDVGYLIRRRQHHKHGYYLIKHGDLSGLTVDEVDIVANVVRYHRRAIPHKKHAMFEALSGPQRKVVKFLSAMLRITDGLDRSQFGVVQDVSVSIKQCIQFDLVCSTDPELEVWAAQKRAAFLEKLFNRPVQFVFQIRNGQ
ncbi:MAG: Ppx/GppA family phosphatase [Nitrospirales bacterium]|nr:Ppx/GppA family phosphatase [Nitrospira sp.]MDR4500019.1 Ppx/GppA family phosphatase [Nitrospirales bacterium]